MQSNATVQQPNIEIAEINGDSVVRILPQELVGILPETIWSTLSLDQKKEILRQHNLFEKYFSKTVEGEDIVQIIPNVIESTDEVSVEKGESSFEKVGGEEFAKAVEEVRSIKEQIPVDEVVKLPSQEDLVMVEEEQATKANTQNYKFFGYQPATSTYSNPKKISDENPITDSKTWAATLIAKILQIFQ